MTPVVFNYKDYVQDNTIHATEFTVTKTINGVTSPEDLTGAIIKCNFKHEEETILKEIGSGITVTDPSGGVFVIDEFKLLKAGHYVYDVKIIFPNGTNKTYIKGQVKILAAVTL